MRHVVAQLIFFTLLVLPGRAHRGIARGITLTVMRHGQAHTQVAAFVPAVAGVIVTHEQVNAAVNVEASGAKGIAQPSLPGARARAGHIDRFPRQTRIVAIVAVRELPT